MCWRRAQGAHPCREDAEAPSELDALAVATVSRPEVQAFLEKGEASIVRLAPSLDL